MVTAGMDEKWQCVFANDIDERKCATYRQNWGDDVLTCGDIRDIDLDSLRQPIDLYWASSPCQDFSLAGKGAGLSGARSGVFTSWIEQISRVSKSGHAPRLIAFENVNGLMSRNQGRDFSIVLNAFVTLGYRVGALSLDARDFLPQSRQRLFVVALRMDCTPPRGSFSGVARERIHSPLIRTYLDTAPRAVRENWIWWSLPEVEMPVPDIATIMDRGTNAKWLTETDTRHLLSLVPDTGLQKIERASACGERRYLTVYKRGRPTPDGSTRQRAEIRDDGIAGCLRTPGGGSSRQTVLEIEGSSIRARLISPRETARLMGLPDTYILPEKPNDAYRLTGDGVAVPIVAFLRQALFEPLLAQGRLRDVA